MLIDAGSQPLGAYDVSLHYDPRLMRFASVQGGTAQGFGAEPGSADDGAGTLRLLAFNASGQMQQRGGGSVARVSFERVAGMVACTAVSAEAATVVDVGGASVSAAATSCAVDLGGTVVNSRIGIACPTGMVTPAGNFAASITAAVGVNILGAYDLTADYDPNVLSFAAASGGSAPGFADVASDAHRGEVRLLAFNESNPMSEPGGGEVARLNFHAVGPAGTSSSLALRLGVLVDTAGNDIDAATQCCTVQLAGTRMPPLDVDESGGEADVFTDLVYVARRLFPNLRSMPVPPSFRALDPGILDDPTVAARVDALSAALDVDSGGGAVDPFTDVVYCARALLNLRPIVPVGFRALDPTIPPDEIIDARCRALAGS